MVVGGLQKSSLIDYPGKISCVLFLSGCNFACPYCHNPDLARGFLASDITENSIYDFLESRREFLDGVVISGGEPTLQKDLIQLCRKTKQMGYPVKIDTNGSRPLVVQILIDEGLVDYVAMDIKTDPTCYFPLIEKKYSPENIIASIRIIMESKIDYEFRTTCIKPFIDANVIESISRLISGAKLYVLQKFQNNTGVLRPEFFNGNECGCSDEELMHLKSIAKPWVKRCIVR
ncbi:MAG: anaerobic ribonucleoside-triphosphate reductase activating protein [Desulfobacteraceae bacterium]|nr:anaerobic ribonucleoside-triphosphate reductase activating protein [Pseudomonadota bacterium]MBU4463770.1 anaerobic ribonucleoside-triphosphate reductase activating protein [Pseudomonadota bacterium]MCG2754633.1 anaerobic ribonucleoside-triphosphate reductase activating protein [Desulfobacteraceae bacterium]NQT09980.1 anaerobic ribonucleoside-triphosphate reductase activating protein [Desulfobacteraceae bacterium]